MRPGARLWIGPRLGFVLVRFSKNSVNFTIITQNNQSLSTRHSIIHPHTTATAAQRAMLSMAAAHSEETASLNDGWMGAMVTDGWMDGIIHWLRNNEPEMLTSSHRTMT
jgi:hypothetical protein